MEEGEGALSFDFEGGLETGTAAGGTSALGPDGTSIVQTPAGPLPVPNSNAGQKNLQEEFQADSVQALAEGFVYEGGLLRVSSSA